MGRRSSVATGLSLVLLCGVVGGCAEGRTESTFKPQGAPAGAGSAAPPVSTGQEFDFPPDLKIVFDDPLPSDPVHGRIIADLQYYERAIWYARLTHGKDHRFYERLDGDAKTSIPKVLMRSPEIKQGLKGTLRFHRTLVYDLYQGRTAEVRTCVDATRFIRLDAKTRRPLPAVPDWAYYLEVQFMKRGADGVWRVIANTAHTAKSDGAKECKP